MGEEKKALNVDEIMERLAEPFPEEDIEWRMNRTYKKDANTYGGWVVAYVSSRAIMNRLDDVLGIDGWEDEYKPIHNGFSCGIRVWFSETKSRIKWDAADPTKYEATKGGFSSALKRAAVKWGVGRYLYEIPEQHVDIYKERNKGFHYHKEKDSGFVGYWNNPKLPKKYQAKNFTKQPMLNPNLNGSYGNQQENSNNNQSNGDNADRNAILNWIEEAEEIVGIQSDENFITRIFSSANPQSSPVIQRSYIISDASIEELKNYVNALKPVKDVQNIASAYDCTRKEIIDFAQIVKTQMTVNGLRSLFFKLDKDDVSEIQNIAKQHAQNKHNQTA